MTDTPPDTETLAALIDTRRGRRTFKDLADASHGRLGSSRWQQLADPGHEVYAPRDNDTIFAIADVLGVPVLRVWLAIGVSRGLPLDLGTSRFIGRLPLGTERFTTAAEDTVLDLIRYLIRGDAVRTAATPAPEQAVHVLAARRATGNEDRGTPGATTTPGGARRGRVHRTP